MYDGRQPSAAHHTLADSLQAPNDPKRFQKETTQLYDCRILGILGGLAWLISIYEARGAEMQKKYG